MLAFLTEVKKVSSTAIIYNEFLVWFQNFEDKLMNAGGFGYAIMLITLGLTIKYGWYVTVSNKRVIEMGKSQKHNFYSKLILFNFFVKR